MDLKPIENLAQWFASKLDGFAAGVFVQIQFLQRDGEPLSV
jgi:hypothetical protein